MTLRLRVHILLVSGLFGWGILNSRAACTACFQYSGPVSWGTASITALTEASGIASSGRNPGVLWTHNDGANGKVFALSTNGARLATFDVNNVDDVEDIAVGPGPATGVSYLYLGDIGGNVGTNTVRPTVKIVRIPEPFIDLAWATNARSPGFNGRDTFTLVYPDGSFDAETLMVDPLSGDLVVVTKDIGAARFYRANLTGVADGGTVTMQFVQSVAFNQASSGDISASGNQIILRRETTASLWARCDGEPLANALSRSPQTVPIVGPPVEPNGEGIGFLRDGTGYVTISEGIDPVIYFFRSTCLAAPQFSLSPSNQTVFAGGTVQFRSGAAGFPDPTYVWRFNGQVLPGQTRPDLVVSNVTSSSAGTYEVTASNSAGSISRTATLTVRAKPDLRITEVLTSAAASPGVPTADWWELTSFESQPVTLTGWRLNDNAGGLTDPFVINVPVTINPGESIVFAEALSLTQFQNWWGTNNLPTTFQVVNYSGAGLSLGAGGDGLRLWDNFTTDVNDTVASVDFGAATAGVTFNYNPATQQFGSLSQLGVNGVVRALNANDIGSPGRISAPPSSPALSISRSGNTVRIGFQAVAGRRYSLEVRDNLTSGTWTPTGDTLQATSNTSAFFEQAPTGSARFFRIVVE